VETPLLLSPRGTPPCKSQSSKEQGSLKKNEHTLSLLIHPREIQSKSSITALHTAQTSIIVFAQIPSQIHRKVIKKKRKIKKITHIGKATSNKAATELF